MVVCNIVHDPKIDWESEDGRILAKYAKVPAINVVTDITHLHTEVPTLFYGYEVAQAALGPDNVTRSNQRFSKSYSWSYMNREVSYENWIDQFVEESTLAWFKHVENGIDVVFDEFDAKEFVSHLNTWPLIHEGGYEIYIADWRDREVIIHSIKKDTLEYIGIKPQDFLWEIYEMLNFDFLTIDPKRFDLIRAKGKYPLFLDLALASNSNEWVGIDHIIDYYSHIKIDRPKVITYYLKRAEFLRPNFTMYR